MLMVIVAFLGTVIAFELSRGRVQNIRFINFRATNFEFLQVDNNVQKTVIDDNSPVMIFDGDSVLIGSAADIVLPQPGATLIHSKKENWINDLKNDENSKKLKLIFAKSSVVGVSVKENMQISKRAKLIDNIRNIAQEFGKFEHPEIVFIQPHIEVSQK